MVLILGQSVSKALGINLITLLLSEQASAPLAEMMRHVSSPSGPRICAVKETEASDVGICKGQALLCLGHSVMHGGSGGVVASSMLWVLQKPR